MRDRSDVPSTVYHHSILWNTCGTTEWATGHTRRTGIPLRSAPAQLRATLRLPHAPALHPPSGSDRIPICQYIRRLTDSAVSEPIETPCGRLTTESTPSAGTNPTACSGTPSHGTVENRISGHGCRRERAHSPTAGGAAAAAHMRCCNAAELFDREGTQLQHHVLPTTRSQRALSSVAGLHT